MAAPFPAQQRRTRAHLKRLFDARQILRVIHYSSESFDNSPDGKSPRITSIAIRNVESGQTRSFSIHQVAEIRRIPLEAIDPYYDELEKEMLGDLYAYVAAHTDAQYLHWNMRDANYGFEAIEHRYRVLGGGPVDIREDHRHDLANMLPQIYGSDYIGHPRLYALAQENGITLKDFLSGPEEVTAFREKRFVALHQSTLRKVDVISEIAERANGRTLKTRSSWWVQNGGSVRGAWLWLVANQSIIFIVAIVALVLTIIGLVWTRQSIPATH